MATEASPPPAEKAPPPQSKGGRALSECEGEREGEVGSSLVPRPLPQIELSGRGLGTRLSGKRREREGVYTAFISLRGVPSPSLLSTAWRKGAWE